MAKHEGVRHHLYQRGDTLIEVTLALAILSLVLASSFAVATTSFRLGQTARERTALSQQAQNQMEALRSFRDNHTWAEFRSGKLPAYRGIDTVTGGTCAFVSPCFHMEPVAVGANTEWVPVPGNVTNVSGVPGSVVEISTVTPTAQRACGYNFVINYRFGTGGGVANRNHISSRLSNLNYSPSGGPVCP